MAVSPKTIAIPLAKMMVAFQLLIHLGGAHFEKKITLYIDSEDVFKEVKVSTALPCSEGPLIIFSDTLSTWVLKTHLIKKNTHHFLKAKFSTIPKI